MELIFKKSIITDDLKHCYVCRTPYNIELHHCIYGKNRKNADKDGLIVPLCMYHHRGITGVHGKKGDKLDTELKQMCQKKWLEYYDKQLEDFIERYRKNYL